MGVVILNSESDTIALGRLISTKLQAGDIVKFTGPLGAGKTTMVRGIVEGLGANPAEVHSPTFSLVHEYEAPGITINHCDFYRLPDFTALEELGGLEFFSEDRIHLIEWSERLNLPLPEARIITIDLTPRDEKRAAQITSVRKIID